jgi:hypothetical protein
VAKKSVNLARLDELVNELIDLLVDKNAKYKDAWQDFGMFTPLMRIREKLIRVESLTDGRPVLVQDENVMAELMDIIGYGLLAMLWMEGQDGETFQQIINQLRQDAQADDVSCDCLEGR